jgi:hypothetical protein
MLRHAIAAALIAGAPNVALAQLYDSGWRIIQADSLSDVELSGAGVRVNNLVITADNPIKPGQDLANYQFTASVLKKVPEKRNIRIELVGFKADKTPTILSAIVINMYDDQGNKTATGQHRFAAKPEEVKETQTYFIRVMIP